MATPIRRRVQLVQGERQIAVEVVAAGGVRPAAVIPGEAGDAALADRLARAGLMVVLCAGADVEAVTAALARGELGPPPPAIRILPAGERDPAAWLLQQLA